MGIVVLPKPLEEHTDALGDDVMANFTEIVSELNGNLDEDNLADTILAAFFAPGDLKASAIAAAPEGWLLCDGSAVSRATYADLFAAIGTTYGVGNGVSTFNLPDLRGRFPLGVDGAAGRITSSDALGNSSGSEKLRTHKHAVNINTAGVSQNHTHSLPWSSFVRHEGTGFAYNAILPALSTNTGIESQNHIHNVNGNTATTGSGSEDGIQLPPYQVVQFMIKI